MGPKVMVGPGHSRAFASPVAPSGGFGGLRLRALQGLTSLATSLRPYGTMRLRRTEAPVVNLVRIGAALLSRGLFLRLLQYFFKCDGPTALPFALVSSLHEREDF